MLHYFNPVRDGGVVGSVDGLRLNFKLAPGAFEVVQNRLDCLQCHSFGYWQARKIGQYRHVWSFKFFDDFAVGKPESECGEARSFTVGLGHNSADGKVNTAACFLDFNPNKLGENKQLLKVLDLLRSSSVAVKCSRWDCAVDFPKPRREVWVCKDRRKYHLEVSSALTEYLGARNSAGFVKLYDKMAEAGLQSALTRLELTCDGSWSLERIRKSWPLVFATPLSVPADDLTQTSALLVKLLVEKQNRGESIQDDLLCLDKRKRAQIRSLMVGGSFFDFPAVLVAALLRQVEDWVSPSL